MKSMKSKKMLQDLLERKNKKYLFKACWELVEKAFEQGDAEKVFQGKFTPEGMEEMKEILAQYDRDLGEMADSRDAVLISVQAASESFDVSSYAVVYDDEHIEVVSLGDKGLGNRLPREGRDYVGNPREVSWIFPDSSQLQAIKEVVSLVLDQRGQEIE